MPTTCARHTRAETSRLRLCAARLPDPRRFLRLHRRPLGVGQEHPAVHPRRARSADLGGHPPRRTGRQRFDEGERPIPTQRVGFVFQSFNLIGKLTAVDNVMLPFLAPGAPARAQAKAIEVLSRMGLGNRLRTARTSSPAASSSGWRSRGP